MNKLFDQYQLKGLNLKNRLVMAPMTRSRATENGVPGELTPKYYSQRASMGLLISEGVFPSPEGQGYINTPGISTKEQVDGWKKVIDAVHDANGRIFLQLMHVGRISHPDNLPTHYQAVAPSAIAPGEDIFTATGKQEVPEPRELTEIEIMETINAFRKAALNAIEAGADGVEIHGANGYLIHQFLGENSNARSDEFGGAIKKRARFAIEVAKAVVDEIGADKTGFRISPMNLLCGVNEGQQGEELYRYLVGELNKLNLAYLHIMHVDREHLLKDIRGIWENTLIVNRPSRPVDQISLDIDNGLADLSSVGVLALVNPDLVEKLKKNMPLNDPNPQTFYINKGEEGYTDYPTMNEIMK